MVHVDAEYVNPCLRCGGELPTHIVVETERGGHYSGDYDVEVRRYDFRKEGYLVSLSNPEVITDADDTRLEQKRAELTEDITKKVDSTVGDNEFREIVLKEKLETLNKDHNLYENSFSHLTNGLDPKVHYEIPEFGMDVKCVEYLFGIAKEIREDVIRLEDGKKYLLAGEITIDGSKFREVLPKVSNEIEIETLEEDLVFRVKHFKHFEAEGKGLIVNTPMPA